MNILRTTYCLNPGVTILKTMFDFLFNSDKIDITPLIKYRRYEKEMDSR